MVLDLDTQRLEGVLQCLLDNGVEEFQCEGFHVKFATSAARGPEPMAPQERSKPESMWHTPALWADGKPPGFPGKDD